MDMVYVKKQCGRCGRTFNKGDVTYKILLVIDVDDTNVKFFSVTIDDYKAMMENKGAGDRQQGEPDDYDRFFVLPSVKREEAENLDANGVDFDERVEVVKTDICGRCTSSLRTAYRRWSDMRSTT